MTTESTAHTTTCDMAGVEHPGTPCAHYCDCTDGQHGDPAIGPMYPHVEVELTGHNGNVFVVLGRTARALRKAGIPADAVSAFYDEATSGDYDHVLQTVMRTVNVS